MFFGSRRRVKVSVTWFSGLGIGFRIWLSRSVFLSHRVTLCVVQSVDDTKSVHLWIVLKTEELVRETVCKALSFNVCSHSYPQTQMFCLSWFVWTTSPPWARKDCPDPEDGLCVSSCALHAPVSMPRPHWTLPSSRSPSQSSGCNRRPLTYPGWVTEGTMGVFSPPGGSGSLPGMAVRTHRFMQPAKVALTPGRRRLILRLVSVSVTVSCGPFPLFGGTGGAQGRRCHPSAVLTGLQALLRFLTHWDPLPCCCLFWSEMSPSSSPLPEPWVFVQCPTWTSVRPS